jgi:spore coat polysaccharide biosynthesis protein SpsF
MNLVIIQAHMGSTRLPGKVMKKFCNKEVLLHVYDRCCRGAKVDKVVIATSLNKENDVIEELCHKNGLDCFRGSENDVLDRYYECAKKYQPKIIIRVTSDCPLLEPKLIDFLVSNIEKDQVEFVEEEKGLLIGHGTDVFSMKALEKLKKNSFANKQKEHVIGYYLDNKNEFTSKTYPLGKDLEHLFRPYRLTLDTKEDYELLNFLYTMFYKDGYADLKSIIDYIDHNPEILDINKCIQQKDYFQEN